MTAAQRLVDDVVDRLRPLEKDLNLAWWELNTNASDEAERRRTEIELKVRAVLADADTYREISEALDAERTAKGDAQLIRQLELLRNWFTPNQIPEDLRVAIVELETSIESTYNTFRGSVDGRPVNDNDIEKVLAGSDDSEERRKYWEASKEVGAEVAPRIRELAHLRNQAAEALKFRDFYAMALATSELDETRLFATLDDVDRATGAPFRQWKDSLDRRLAKRFKCEPGDINAWHYDDPFFQDPPRAGGVDLDPFFEDADIEGLTIRTYDGLNIQTRSVLERSDLYAREGKSQHAFCMDIDRHGDVRTLCNVIPNERWMGTMLHEFGHAVYDLGIDGSLPWMLRSAAHALTTEGVAMLMGRLVRDPDWLHTVAGIDAARVEQLRPELQLAQKAALLVFARWVLVMTHFERGLYANPDGDHDTAWWELVERFQLVPRPQGRSAPDWAAKVHVAVAPVYYQNYLYGELVASQLEARIRGIAAGMVDRPLAGRFLNDDVFGPGSSLRWDQLLERATGEPLSVRHLVAQMQ